MSMTNNAVRQYRTAAKMSQTDCARILGIPASLLSYIEGGAVVPEMKIMGCGTYGAESVEVEDDEGRINTVKFSYVKYVDVDITVNIKQRAGYAASTATEISTAIVEYLSSFSIGTDLTTSIIWMVSQQVNTDYRTPTFSIQSVQAARHGEEQSVDDVVIDFDEVARGNMTNITINVT